MPAFLTHWRVLIETARRSQDAGNDLGSLIIDTAALRRGTNGSVAPPQTPPAGAVWDTGPLPRIDFSFPGSDISAMAYLGALAPDITYYRWNNFRDKLTDRRLQRQRSPLPSIGNQVQWADLLHYNRSGDMLLTFLEHVAQIPSPAVRSQGLAFAMGYLSHIATDIALNPYINTLAGDYRRSDIPATFILRSLDMGFGLHFYIELCLDEYVASTYFNHSLYSWTNLPWRQYIEPAAGYLATPKTLSAQVLDLLATAAEVTYSLTEEQREAFHQAHLTGVGGLRRYLAGGGIFRLLTLRARTRKRQEDQILARILTDQHEPGTTSFEDAIEYTIRVSERLCRRGISYYASLRNTMASAQERNQRRVALRDDLRNWNLDTGYAMDVTFDQEATLHLLHNWIHFAELWENEARIVAQGYNLMR